MRLHNEKPFYKVSKYNNNKEGESERFVMKWTNSICAENHHYVIQGKLDSWDGNKRIPNNIDFTSKTYLKTPGNNFIYHATFPYESI